MSAVAVHQLLKEEGIFGGLLALHTNVHQFFGWQNDGVPPLNLSAVIVSSTADEAHIHAHNFGIDAVHEVFFQPKRIRRTARFFLHCHCRNFPTTTSPHEASGQCGTTSGACRTLNFHLVAKFRFRAASCLTSKQFARVPCIGTCVP